MEKSWSKSQIDKLGDRLRRSEKPSEEDLRALEEVRLLYGPPLRFVSSKLEELSFQPTSRLKTTATIADKLKRATFKLSQIQDVGGARIVGDWTLGKQDEIVSRLTEVFSKHDVVDRRAHPSHGYRAVHVIVTVEARPIEIQVRTRLQDGWANTMESIGDRLGRAIRYAGAGAGGLSDGQRMVVDHVVKRSEIAALLELQRDQHSQYAGAAIHAGGTTAAEFHAKRREFRSLEEKLLNELKALEFLTQIERPKS